MAEFNLKKSSCLEEQTIIIDKDGSLKATNEYGDIFADQNSVKVGKTPYCLEIPKIRATVYVSEGVRTIHSYRLLNNSLYKAGYAEALIGGAPSRRLALEELESVSQFPGALSLKLAADEKSRLNMQWRSVSIVLDSK